MSVDYLKPVNSEVIKAKPTKKLNVRIPVAIHAKLISFQNSDISEFGSMNDFVIQSMLKEMRRIENESQIQKITRRIIRTVKKDEKQKATTALNQLIKIVENLESN